MFKYFILVCLLSSSLGNEPNINYLVNENTNMLMDNNIISSFNNTELCKSVCNLNENCLGIIDYKNLGNCTLISNSTKSDMYYDTETDFYNKVTHHNYLNNSYSIDGFIIDSYIMYSGETKNITVYIDINHKYTLPTC